MPVTTKVQNIFGTDIETKTADFFANFTSSATAGTNGYFDENSWRDSRTYLKLDFEGANVKVKSDEKSVELSFCGNDELSAVISTLQFALNVLRSQSDDRRLLKGTVLSAFGGDDDDAPF